jgi:hypothetical protein
MTKRLEEEFNLTPLEDLQDTKPPPVETSKQQITTLEDALSLSEKINGALAEVRGMEAHDSEMDDIASQAVESYEQLMSLGMNMTDMAAGPVFANAANMLKIALEAKDSKTTRKLKQIDLMLKKANLDAKIAKEDGATEATATMLDRNELLKMLGKKTN